MNIRTNNQRVLSYIEWVRESQPRDVAERFLTALEKTPDPTTANMPALLEEIRRSGPDAAERMARDAAMLKIGSQRFTS